MLVPPESSSAVLVMISSKSVSIKEVRCPWCLSATILALDKSTIAEIARFQVGYPNLMRSYGGFLEPRGSRLTPLKSKFNAEHFIRRLSWSIVNGFGAIQS